jgi:hypothetical protein
VPESSLADNWPKPVRDAANAIQDYFHTNCSSDASSDRTASTDASDPENIVADFIAALNAHDTDAAKRLLTARQAQQITGAADSWLTNVKSITNVTIGEATPERRDDYKQAVKVPVEFDLDQRQATSLPNGHISWGYLLVRNSDEDPWRIDDQGVA